ncbi:MAG: hypothetical protein IPL61_09220 [Myxococcales bacterium]|nr:hypothetical protein [Myxococcales bacterium]
MKRWIVPTLLVAAVAAAVIFYRDNRALRRQLAQRPSAAADPWQGGAAAPAEATGPSSSPLAGLLGRRLAGSGPAPKLEPAPAEGRLDRRLRRQEQMAALLGRDPGESEEAYKARVLPLIELALGGRRADLDQLRKNVEAAAGVTDAQRAELDAAFSSVYDEVVAFTDAAVADGSLTPYDRNVKGLLQYAGGLGSILEGAEGRVGSILSADQVRSIHGSGFEWGEYLGVMAPWERLQAPPPRP